MQFFSKSKMIFKISFLKEKKIQKKDIEEFINLKYWFHKLSNIMYLY